MDRIQNLVIFYFSGTGNAKKIALWLSELAAEKNIDCQIFDIARIDVSKLEEIMPTSLIGIISPIHGFNYPKITLDFINRLPAGKNRVVLMNTRAGMKIGSIVTPGLTGIAFMLSSIILRRKGYKVVGQIPFDMPSNWISIHPALRGNAVKFIYEINYERLKKHSDKIFSGQADFLAHKDFLQDILVSPVSLGYYIAGRFSLAKSFYTSSECDSCGLCERSCPVNAIKNSKTRPFWTFKCESCMKCMNICPRQAIQAAHGLWIILIIISVLMTDLCYEFLLDSLCFWGGKLVLFTLIFLVLLLVLYQIQYWLLRSKFFAKLICYSSLTYYRFWGRYRCK